MWKSEWKIDKTWMKGKERWLILLICGLLLLILAVPAGWETEDSGQEVWAEQSGGKRLAAAEWLAAAEQTAAGERLTGADRPEALDLPPGSEQTAGTNPQLSSFLSQNDEARAYEKELEARVRDILKHVDGVGEVDVMITLRSSKETVYRVDTDKNRTSTEEEDSSGGTRRVMTEEIAETSLLSGGSGGQEPVIEKELQPEIAGIVISAQGGGSATVKAEISEAMEALFGLPAHKIKVLKRAE